MKTIQTIIFCLISILGFTQIPPGYYDSAIGLTGDQLKGELHNIIDNHIEKSYGDARYILDESDRDPNNASNVLTIYSNHSVSGTWDSGATWNREHVWAKSRGFGSVSNSTYGTGSDLHNLRACIPQINSDKGNRWFAYSTTPYNYNSTWTGSNFSGANPSSSVFNWEPRDEDKGDVARIIFYMATRYEGDVTGEPDLEIINSFPSNTTTDPVCAILDDLYQWHLDDPVDDFERNRNNVIYSYQNNRNPYIDHPEYVGVVWFGELSVENTEINTVSIYPNPSNGILNVTNTKNQNIEVYNSLGELIKVSRENQISLKSGFYLIKVGQYSQSVIVE